MTMIDFDEIACGICGAKGHQFVLHSTSAFGSSDLDLRAPDPARSTMNCWLQYCWECGMVAPDLEKAEQDVKELLKAPDYLRASRDHTVPALARHFVCRSMIEEALDQYRDAFGNLLAAAWVADDEGLDDAARDFRTRAAAELGKVSDLENEEKVQLLDVLRRAGQWDAAEILADELTNAQLDHTLNAVVDYETKLIGERERGCRTVEQAMAGA